MAKKLNGDTQVSDGSVSHKEMIDLLNEDLAREYQAIIAYVVYSQVIKGASYMTIAAELEKHAGEELEHAIKLARQIDFLGGVPNLVPKPVRISNKSEELLRFDLDNEVATIENYRQRIRQAEAAGEFALSETLRVIILQEQDHAIALSEALGIDVPLSPSTKP